MDTTLFVKVCMLLTGAMICGGLGALLARKIESLGAVLGLFVAAIAGIFVTISVAHADAGAGIVCLMIWTGVVGAVVGPALQHYSESLGWHTVFGATVGTGGVMAVCGIIGAMSGIDFGFLGGILGIALIALIVFGLIGLFVGLSREVQMGQAIIGMIVFSGYFMFDFWRLSKAANTWQAAIQLTMSLYLDFVNFLLYLLQFLEKSKEHASAIQQNATDMLALGGHHAVTLATAAAHSMQPVLSLLGVC